MTEWMTAIVSFMSAAAISFVVLAAATSYLRFEAMTKLPDAADGDGADDLDPYDVLKRKLAGVVASSHKTREPFSLLLCAPVEADAWRAAYGAEALARAIERMQPGMKRLLRDTDLAYDVGDRYLGLLLPLPPETLPAIAARLRETCGRATIEEAAGLPSCDVAFGGALFPEDADTAAGLLAAAERALNVAASDPSRCRCAAPASGPHAKEAAAPDAAFRDPLTGVLRHERMGAAARKYMAQSRRADRPVALMAVELCRMEESIERYGRAVVDRMLHTVADRLMQTLREEDLIGRLGEGAFLVVLRSTAGGAVRAGERALQNIRHAAVEVAGGIVRPSANIAVVAYPEHGKTLPVLVEQAQRVLEDLSSMHNVCRAYAAPQEGEPRRARRRPRKLRPVEQGPPDSL